MSKGYGYLSFSLLVMVALVVASHSGSAQETSGGFGGGSVKIGYDNRTCDGTLEGSIRYNSSTGVAEFCDGSSWTSPGTSATPCTDDDTAECLLDSTRDNSDSDFSASNIADGVNILGVTGTFTGPSCPYGCGNAGDLCADGTYYIGLSPADGGPVYMTSAAYETSSRWDEASCYRCGSSDTGATSATDGRANAEALRSYSGGSAEAGNLNGFGAAKYCDDLVAHGHDDWYLPAGATVAGAEQLLLYTVGAVGGLDKSGARYWSSTENSSNAATGIYLNNGFQNNSSKDNTNLVRCIRREPSF